MGDASPPHTRWSCVMRRAAARLVVGTGDGAGSARADRRKIFGGEWKKSSDSYESELLIVPQTGIEPVRVSLPTGF